VFVCNYSVRVIMGRLNLGGNDDTFRVIGNVGEGLKDAVGRCVLRRVNVSKRVCGRGSAPRSRSRWGIELTALIQAP